MKLKRIILASLGITLITCTASATPFTIETYLTGDPRGGKNMTDIVANVTITGDTTSNVTHWEFSLENDKLYPDAKLLEFYFNLNVDHALVSFSNSSPSVWTESYFNGPSSGSGNANFQYNAYDTATGKNKINITNLVDLKFDVSLSSGYWTADMFYSAPKFDNGALDPYSFQLGAHISTISSYSGYAIGNYGDSPPDPVPEPTAIILFGSGLTGLFISRRKKKA